MKTNSEHRCIPIYLIAKYLIFGLIAISGTLFAATWDAKETPVQFSYEWDLSQSDITQFVKTGQISQGGIAGSFYYKGRYYPVYTILIENTADQVVFQIKNKEEALFMAPDLFTDYGDINPQAIDYLDIREMSDFVRLQPIPGIGTLLEITPLIPLQDGQIKCLKKASIYLLPTTQKSLQKADLKKEKPAFAKTATLKTNLPDEFLALYIQEPGVYQVSGQDLADRDIDLRTIHPDNIKLSWRGEEIPCRVTSTYELDRETFQYHDVVQFYIPELKNPYGNYLFNPFSDYDVVQMSWSEGNGLRYIQENSEITGNAIFLPQDNRTFRSTVHIEKNILYEPLARLHEEELSHKYEHEFYSPAISIGRSVTFPFYLWNPALDSPYNVEFTIRMQGLTYSVSDEMDHQIYITVNDQYLLEDEWEGQLPKISSNANMQYNHENLFHGENEIDISVKGFADNPYLDDKVLFDWLEVSYDRYMIAYDNKLRFSPQYGPGTYLFQVKGLTSASDVLILKNETNWIRGYYVTPEDTVNGEVTYSIYFEDECRGDEVYQITGPGKLDNPSYGIISVDSIRYVNTQMNDFYNTNEQGDYVIITHKDFYEKALELVEHKYAIGFKPVIYELERIYDEYNYSNESPYAIKTFLTDAYTTWHTLPRYVLFIGDVRTENPLPSIKYQSTGARGAILTESWFVDIDDDFVMEMALGRLPISNEDELDSIIIKIKAFDLIETPSQKINRVALLTGPESTFKDQMQDYINNVSPDYIQTDRLYLYDSHLTGDFDAGIYATDTLVKFINDGIFCLNYLGHGGGYTWDNYVLPYSAFDEFTSVNPFIVNSLTCFTNTFSNDNALGEMFIRHPRGSVSVLSSTGYGWLNSNHYFYKKLMEHMFNNNMSHGEAFQYAMTDYFFSSFGRNANFIDHVDGRLIYKYFRKSMFYQFCILGDPSARFPEKQITDFFTLAPQSVTSGGTITLQVEEPNITKGVMDIVGTRQQERKFPLQQKIKINFNQNETAFVMPYHDNSISDGIIQLTYWDESDNVYVGAEHIALNAPYIESINYYPLQPAIGDSGVAIRMNITSNRDPDGAYLRIYNDQSTEENYQKLALTALNNTLYETGNNIYYTGESTFYTAENDTSEAIAYYSGNYFMPVFFIDGDSLTGDFYRLAPQVSLSKDIAILEYAIENGESKLVLYNQADTSVHVALTITVLDSGFTRSYHDTLLTINDVDGQYESGTDKINTYYLDFLPTYGASTLEIEINPIEINDTDTSNNRLQLSVQNQWLVSQNGTFVNILSDTLKFPGDTFMYLNPGESNLSYQTIYINTYNRNYSLSQFGASQAVQNLLYINTPNETIDFTGSLSLSVLNDNKIICYLSTDMTKFYTLPITVIDSLVHFPIRKAGYYIVSYPNESISPDIEINLNARKILTRAYVSERSDFSAMIRDDHGVNPLTEFWDILLDDEEINEENVSFIQSDNIREIGINFKLDINVGEHTLQIIAHDLVGNRTETEEYQIIYTGESQLINYSNFPNPFTVKTTFIYELTEQFDDVVIKIYTLSGQKIFTMSVEENAITDLPLYSIGYHEVPWYGKDEFGNTVANGVYFYIIEGLVDGEKIKSTGKIAKLR